MPTFSKSSLDKLITCDPKLQKLFNEVIKYFDCVVVFGHRGKEDQDKAFAEGNSKVQWPNGKHNTVPSKAIDVAPFINGKISWDSKQCLYFGGIVKGIATMLGIDIRYGGDWDSDNDVTDNKFNDLVHVELKE
ncbi:MAG: M15 family peptidase [Candidatus Omnitrophica bacterium]|jgi:hypothetical protein|nr:M15 family peptidase [Candidatus Omnitrophota bacterium]